MEENIEEFEVLQVTVRAILEEEWKSLMSRDVILKAVIENITNGWPKKCSDLPCELQPFWNVRDELSIAGTNVLKADKIIPPEELRIRISEIAHEGHLGRSLTKSKLRSGYWFPGMDTLIENLVKECHACGLSDKTKSTRRTPLEPVHVPIKAWEKLGLDFFGPLQISGLQERFIIVLVDYFSKWVTITFVNKVDTKTIILFLSDVFANEGIPHAHY